MLPALQETDVLSHKPDIDELDIWQENFSWKGVPSRPGVYCFYDADTKAPLYIGSAAARSNCGQLQGLAARLQQYRSIRLNSPSVKKVRAARKEQRVLVRCWIAQTAGEAAKYECDALEKYRPPLNARLVGVLCSQQDRIQAERVRRVRYHLRPPAELPPESSKKRCPDCKKEKTLAEFHHQGGFKDGHQGICKTCACERLRGLRRRYRLRSQNELPELSSSKHCPSCRQIKPLSEFGKDTGAKDGRDGYCRSCRSYRKRGAKNEVTNPKPRVETHE